MLGVRFFPNQRPDGPGKTAATTFAAGNKKITGAALDVLENEELSSYSNEEKSLLNELLLIGEIVVTPHIAGKSFQSRKKFAEVLLSKISKI